MSVELELTVKIRMSEAESPVKPTPVPLLARLLARLTAHPCVVMILREFMGRS